MDTGQFTDIMDKKVKKIYIKDGKRKMQTDTGHMMMPAKTAKRMFGAHRGGKYSKRQGMQTSSPILPRDPKTGFPKGFDIGGWGP